MADNGDSNSDNILTGDANSVHAGQIVTVSVGNGQQINGDILQQALNEASGSFGQESIAYVPTQVSNVATLADSTAEIGLGGSTHIALAAGSGTINTVGEDGVIYSLGTTDGTVQGSVQQLQQFAGRQIVGDSSLLQQLVQNQLANGEQGFVVQLADDGISQDAIVHQEHQSQELVEQNSQLEQHSELNNVTSEPNSQIVQVEDASQQSGSDSGQQTSQVQNNLVTRAIPLGSSTNPIRIVQQGNQYTSLQQLSPDQLSQIMQVVQQQQLLKTAESGKKSSILFNPQTQTRIVYKVLYPSELHKTKSPDGESENQPSTSSKQVRIYIPSDSLNANKKHQRKRKFEDDEKAEAPELSREEKEEKKKHRPRTRSGRVSRPPRHMIKDYKHIHPVDWDEDYDDSDGGYSDFHPSSGSGEEEVEEEGGTVRRRKKDGNYTHYSLIGHGKAKPWKCKVCEKAYIGKAGLARHYRLSPEHGKDDENFKDIENFSYNGLDSGNSMDSMPEGPLSNSTSEKPTQEGSVTGPSPVTSPTSQAKDSLTKTLGLTESSSVTVGSNTALTNGVKDKGGGENGDKSVIKNPGISRAMANARKTFATETTPARKKSKLKEYIRDFSDEELMELVMPRLSQAVSPWEYILLRVEKGRPSRPQLVDVLQEYATIYRRVRSMADEQLHPITNKTDIQGAPQGATQIQISDPTVAQSLGLTTGLYSVYPKVKKDTNFHYKLLTTDPSSIHSPSTKRTVEAVAPEGLISPEAKRQRTSQSVVPNYHSPEKQLGVLKPDTVLPGQTLLKPNIAALLDASKQNNSSQVETENSCDNFETAELSAETFSMKIEEQSENFKQEFHAGYSQNMENGDESIGSHQGGEPLENHQGGVSMGSHHVNQGGDSMQGGNSVGSHQGESLNNHQGDESIDSQQAHQSIDTHQEDSQSYSKMDADCGVIFTAENSNNFAISGDSGNGHASSVQLKTEPKEAPVSQHSILVEQPPTTEIESLMVPPGVDSSMSLSIEGSTLDGHLVDSSSTITQQFVTDQDSMIVQEQYPTQILIQGGESYIDPNQTTQDSNQDLQDPNEDNRLIMIKNPDGTIQIHRQGNQPISLETLQALLGMELDVPIENLQAVEQTEGQE